jgi:hypothetical protein
MINGKDSHGGSAAHAWRPSTWGLDAHHVLPIIVAALVAVIWVATFSLAEVERAGALRNAVMSTRDLLATYEAQVVRALRETDQTLLKAHWSKIIFTGRGKPPLAVPNSAEARKLLATNPHAIAYLDRSELDNTVKAVHID